MPEEITWLALGQSVLMALVILVIGWLASKWAHLILLSLARGRKLDESLSRLVASLVQYAVLATAVIAALGAVGIETTSLVAIFASAGLAVGLALQGSLANFASGVMLLFFRPFDLGDLILAGGHEGEVKDVGLFATTMLTLSNEKIIIPNTAITGGSIINYSVMGTRRASIAVGVAYGTDVTKTIEVLMAAAARPSSSWPIPVQVLRSSGSEPTPSTSWCTAGATATTTPR